MTYSNPLEEKSYKFALEVVLFCKDIIQNQKEYILTKQCIRSATSIGANISEAQQSESRKDFISKFSISIKEGYETRYWLSLLRDSYHVSEEQTEKLLNYLDEIISILVTSVRTAKKNLNKK